MKCNCGKPIKNFNSIDIWKCTKCGLIWSMQKSIIDPSDRKKSISVLDPKTMEICYPFEKEQQK